MLGGASFGTLLLSHGLASPLIVSSVCVLAAAAAYAAAPERPPAATVGLNKEIR